MSKIYDLFFAIGSTPEGYLPEKSLTALKHFLSGHSARMAMYGHDSILRGYLVLFQSWLDKHFDIRAGSRSIYLVVDSYSAGSQDAFDNFYILFDAFLKEGNIGQSEAPLTKFMPSKMELCEVLKSIRKRPELYIGHPHFLGVHSYLSGHIRAGVDIGLPKSDDEMLYEEFQRWIVVEKFSGGKPRPWFRLIGFHSFYDCGTPASSAYAVFYKLLDEFAVKIGKSGLFEVE